ncbi:hypothetical protein NUW54_g10776 [Trametes sanguinea]|uniref:Uncharacterized protein n=1 Tax=Trametes sanguinea TaxID=158606 RepID=A0ACC1NTK0_9APHY|nr:hypothetical protein NUW54_g10776 [Trametes sanguinea]
MSRTRTATPPSAEEDRLRSTSASRLSANLSHTACHGRVGISPGGGMYIGHESSTSVVSVFPWRTMKSSMRRWSSNMIPPSSRRRRAGKKSPERSSRGARLVSVVCTLPSSSVHESTGDRHPVPAVSVLDKACSGTVCAVPLEDAHGAHYYDYMGAEGLARRAMCMRGGEPKYALP